MKRIFFLLFVLAATFGLRAQNIQLHYDFGRHIYSNEESSRQNLTITLEQFKADKLGSWFYFVDVDLTRRFTESAYTEIAREFNLGKKVPLAAHIEYNGGVARTGSFQQSGLVGIAYNGHTEDFSKTWAVQVLYKQYFESYDNTNSYPSVQLTGVWGLNFFNNHMTFSGFIDFWRGEKSNGDGCLVILSEPQLWYNFNEHLSFGTELEFSNNFIFNQDPKSSKTFFLNPTVAIKWNF